jgi:acyl-CoA thioester hydrolase
METALPEDAVSASSEPTVPTDAGAYRFWTEEHVRFADLDPLGHANNNAIGTYFEAARLFARAGRPLGAGGRSVVLARIAIDFRAELQYASPVRIGSKVLAIGRTSLTLASAIFDGDRCAASAQAVCVVFDLASRRPAAVDEALRTRLMEIAG